MKYYPITPAYIIWHYSQALRNMWGISTNFAWFVYHFFSVPVFVRDIFEPWYILHRSHDEHADGGIESLRVSLNATMRGVGLLIRSLTIIFALAIIASIFIFVALLTILWLLIPVILVAIFATAMHFILI